MAPCGKTVPCRRKSCSASGTEDARGICSWKREGEGVLRIVIKGGYNGKKNGTALALGYFDGLHIGHEAVIKSAREYAEAHGLDSGVFTFTVDDGRPLKGRQVLSLAAKHEELDRLGVVYCFEPPFSSIRNLSPREFFTQCLLGEYQAKALFCGPNYGFGARRTGDIQMLGELCDEFGVKLVVTPLTFWRGQRVSSTRIREALGNGAIEDVNAMLGRPYEVDFPVQHGRKLGSTLGFPTINQYFPSAMQPPREGVYITETVVDDVKMPSVTGYGNRPTVNGTEPTCETFIPGYSGDLYGKHVRVLFHKRIAATRKFESTSALAEAVLAWAEEAKAYLADQGRTPRERLRPL